MDQPTQELHIGTVTFVGAAPLVLHLLKTTSADRGERMQLAKLATQCAVCGTTSRPIRPEPSFPATAGRMRLFPGFPSSEGRRRRHGTAGASLDFANLGSVLPRIVRASRTSQPLPNVLDRLWEQKESHRGATPCGPPAQQLGGRMCM